MCVSGHGWTPSFRGGVVQGQFELTLLSRTAAPVMVPVACSMFLWNTFCFILSVAISLSKWKGNSIEFDFVF